MARGDHIYVKRTGYTHHGIDCANGYVIHYTGEVFEKSDAAIKKTKFAEFSSGGTIKTKKYGDCYPDDIVVNRAEKRLGEDSYNLIFNNCEHFASWCKTGEHESEQVSDITGTGAGAIGAGSAVAGGIGVVSASGASAGLSASGIMAGLASTGPAGAVGGILTVGAAPGLIAAGGMHVVLRDKMNLPKEERRARKYGRRASIAGAFSGSAAAVGSVSILGTTAGLSGPGITSGLAVADDNYTSLLTTITLPY